MPSIVAELSKAKQSALKKHNKTYAEEIKLMMSNLPGIAVKSAIEGVYPVVVEETVQDSGLAAYNWWIAVGQSRVRKYIKRKGTGPTTKQRVGRWKRQKSIAEPFRRSTVVMNKMNYMKGVLALPAYKFNLGGTIYNETPESNKQTFKGSYRENAKIRVAVEKGMMEAERAISEAFKRYK